MAEQEKPTTEALLKVVDALDPEKREAEEPAPTDEELASARSSLVDALKAAVEGESPDLEAAKALREGIDKIASELVTREEQREADRQEAAKLLEGVEEPKATEEPEAKAEDEAEGEPEGEKEDEPERKPVTVAASISIGDAIKRSAKRREDNTPPEAPENPSVIVAAAGPAQGYPLGPNADLGDVASLFDRHAAGVVRGGQVFLHMENVYPEERHLGMSAVENTRKIDDVTSLRAITAAGGICEPLPADFSHPICGDRGRPVRDALAGFRADRGGIRFAPVATVADLEPAITVWPLATDADPGTATKACPRVDCEDELSCNVDAIVACLTVGNFQARFNPEFWRSRLDLLFVAHDRIAEQTLLATLTAGSTAVTYGAGDGTVVSVLQALDKAAAGIRSRSRLNASTRLVAIMPAWLLDALRTHLASQRPSGSTDLFTAADAVINGFFTSRNIRPVWSPDVDIFGAQGAGALVDFPGGDVDIILFPEGSWLFLDGGTLDLGTQIADSTLNATNDRQAFMETFEAACFRGCESLTIEVPVAETCICSDVAPAAG